MTEKERFRKKWIMREENDEIEKENLIMSEKMRWITTE